MLSLLDQIGIQFLSSGRSYRPVSSDPTIEAKMLKSQNIPALVSLGRHDCGFCGYDWIVEQNADVVELLDLKFDPVRLIAAVPEEMQDLLTTPEVAQGKTLVVASEYRRLATEFIAGKNLNAIFVRAFGATEALPPEDADMIIDNTASGTTLRHNRLVIIDELMRSTTRFICNREALKNPVKRKKLEEMAMLMESSLRARQKVLLEMNVAADDLERLVQDLPCMRAPTISKLYNSDGYAIKVAVPTEEVAALIPRLVSLGARDVLEYRVDKIVLRQ
ncbi:MAG TPA: ATP phosphoribosyltransferase [Candidatus Obscuribacterales bacterium]